MDFRGSSWNKQCSKFGFCLPVSGTATFLSDLLSSPEAAVAGARLRDTLHLLLRGPHADTKVFEWSSYTRADIEAAASFLEAKRLNVHQAYTRLLLPQGRQGALVGWIGVRLR
jgi:hypothetical protein